MSINMTQSITTYLVNMILGKKEIICPSCAARFSVYKNHAGFELGVTIYCSMGCYLLQNPNPYGT